MIFDNLENGVSEFKAILSDTDKSNIQVQMNFFEQFLLLYSHDIQISRNGISIYSEAS